MAIRLRKLIMLSILFPLGLGAGLSTGEGNALSMPTKEAVSYASSEDLNDHDTNHSSDYNWTSLQNTDASTGGTLSGGDNESATAYYYLEDNVQLSSTLTISGYVTICLNGKYIDGNSNGSVISVSSGAYFNLCDCSGNDSGAIKGGNTEYYGGGLYVFDATFNMYGGTISNNTAAFTGGGMCIDGGSIFNMYGGTISGNTAYYGGGVDIYFSRFNMYGGTISNNTASYCGSVNLEGAALGMSGGYLDGSTYNDGYSIVFITGGYFNRTAYDSIKDYIASNSIGIDISLICSDLDENYVDGYPYAVYAKSTTSYSINDVTDPTYGTEYTPTINNVLGTEYTSVAYTYKNIDDNEISGLPTDVGEYAVTAHFLYTTTEGYITTNSYGTTEFSVTISKGQAVITADATQSKTYDGEVASVEYTVIVGDTDITSDATVTETWYDENDEVISAPTEVGTYKVTLTVTGTDNYDGTSTDVTYTITENSSSASTDSTGLSAGAIAGIVIASVFVVGLIAFLVYFFAFRKKKTKKEEKKSSKKTKK